MKSVFIIFAVVILSGCNPFHNFKPDSEGIQKKSWAPYSPNVPKLEQVYCYRTLGEPQCYRELQKDKNHLLINNHRPGVDDPKSLSWFLDLKDPFN